MPVLQIPEVSGGGHAEGDRENGQPEGQERKVAVESKISDQRSQ